MSAQLIGIGIIAGGCGSFWASRIRTRLVVMTAVQSTPRALIEALARLMTESDWHSFQQGYVRLFAATLRYALSQMLTAVMAVIPIVLAYFTMSLLSQTWEPTPSSKQQFGAGQWAFLCSATVGCLVSPWLSARKN